MPRSNCWVLTCIQISQEVDQEVWHSHLLKNLPEFLVVHTVKAFSIVNKAEIVIFLEISCFFYDPTDVGTLISGSSAFSKSNLNIWKFMYCWSLTWRILGFLFCIVLFCFVFLLACEISCYTVVWAFFGIGFLWDWNENWPFPVLWPLLSFPNLLAYWHIAALSQHHLSGFEIAQLEFHHLH